MRYLWRSLLWGGALVVGLAACEEEAGPGQGAVSPDAAGGQHWDGEIHDDGRLEDGGRPATDSEGPAEDAARPVDGPQLSLSARAVEHCGHYTPQHQPGLQYQTPQKITAAVSKIELLRTHGDGDPVELPLAELPLPVDLSAGQALTAIALSALPEETFRFVRVTLASSRYELRATAHASMTVPGTLSLEMTLSDHTDAQGQARQQGQYTAGFEVYGQRVEQSGSTLLNCMLSAWGGLPQTAGGRFAVTVPLPGGPLHVGTQVNDRQIDLDFPMKDSFSWRDREGPGFQEGVLDISTAVGSSELPDAFAECHLLMADRCEGEAVVAYHPTWPMPDSTPVFCTNGRGQALESCPEESEPGYGQDASYRIHPLQYELRPEVVRDVVTGLEWQRETPTERYDWWAARSYCAELELGGLRDWRLPSRIEMVSIIDFGRLDPVIDLEAFPDTPSEFYWTASPVPFLAFAYGIRFELGFIYDHDPSTTGRVRCVRGAYEAPEPRYEIDEAAGTVRDRGTGLEWQRATLDTPKTWLDALAHCEGLEFAGHDDWRLPTLKETQTIIDERRLQPSVDVHAFPGTPAHWYWSSTPIQSHADQAWATSTTDGYASIHAGTETLLVRCVRDPE